MEIRKAVITAAGIGTRFLPATKAQPKEMLPLVDKPVIQYAVEEAVASGIKHIIVITALGKHAIEDHFDRSFELEYALAEKGKGDLLEEVRRISELADICYIRQKAQLGLGHAILTAEEMVGDEPFAVILPDDIVDATTPVLQQMLDVYERYPSNIVAVERIPREDLASYGVIEPRLVEERVYEVLGLVEKPSPEEAPSDLAIVGRYILMPEVFHTLRETGPGVGGEIQLTDGLSLLLKQQKIYGYEFQGTRYDTGSPLGLLKASVELALKRSDIGERFREYLRQLTSSL